MTKIKFIEKCKLTHSINYDYSRVPDNFKTQEKPYFEIGCPICNSFFRVRYDQFQAGSNCPCLPAGRKIDYTNFEKIKQLHPNLDFSNSVYTGITNNLTFYCKEHGYQTLKAETLLRETSDCPVCNRNKQKLSVEELKENLDFVNFEYKLDKSYYTAKDDLIIVCKNCGLVFRQNSRVHINAKVKCPDCADKSRRINKAISFEEFEERAKLKADYILYETYYKNFDTKTKIFCKTCQRAFETKPARFLEAEIGCPVCSRKNMGKNKMFTQEEAEDWVRELCGNNFTFKPFVWDSYRTEIEFTCLKHNIFFKKTVACLRTNGICCPDCKPKSIREKQTNDYLKNLGLEMGKDYLYNSFMFQQGEEKLFTDFYLIKEKIWIEINGEQHEHWVKYFQPTYSDFLKQKHHDWLKRKYCRHNNIRFEEIWYYEDLEKRLKSILK